MPYPRDHREKTRARIIDSARKLFNRHGFEQVSIDAIMEGAGLTRGGFYHHFASKEQLYAQAVLAFRKCSPYAERMRNAPAPVPPAQSARVLVDLYLSDAVLADEKLHCPLYALAGDVRRAGEEPRAAYDDLMRGILNVFRRALAEQPGLDPSEAEQRALNLITLCVGGMLLARTTPNAELAVELRRAAQARAHALLAAEPSGSAGHAQRRRSGRAARGKQRQAVVR